MAKEQDWSGFEDVASDAAAQDWSGFEDVEGAPAAPSLADRAISAGKKLFENMAAPFERAPEKPDTVMAGFEAPPAASRTTPANPASIDFVRQSYDRFPESRPRLLARQDWVGDVARQLDAEYRQGDAATAGLPAAQNLDSRKESRIARGIGQGMNADAAKMTAASQGAAGIDAPVAQVSETTDTLADKLAREHGDSDLVRGAVDLAGSVAKVAPTTGKMALDVLQLVPLVGQAAEWGSDALADVIEDISKSQSRQMQGKSAKLAEVVRSGTPDQVMQHLLQNPDLLADVAIPSAGSIFLIGGAGAATGKVVAGKYAGRVSERALARIQQRAATDGAVWANAAANAGSAYDETEGGDLAKYTAALIAGLGTRAVGKLTAGGAEGVIARGTAGGANPVVAAGRTAAGEMAQEFGEGASEALGSQTGQIVEGTRDGLDLRQIANQGAMESIAAGPAGAAVGALNAAPAQAADSGQAAAEAAYRSHVDGLARQALDPSNAQLHEVAPPERVQPPGGLEYGQAEPAGQQAAPEAPAVTDVAQQAAASIEQALQQREAEAVSSGDAVELAVTRAENAAVRSSGQPPATPAAESIDVDQDALLAQVEAATNADGNIIVTGERASEAVKAVAPEAPTLRRKDGAVMVSTRFAGPVMEAINGAKQRVSTEFGDVAGFMQGGQKEGRRADVSEGERSPPVSTGPHADRLDVASLSPAGLLFTARAHADPIVRDAAAVELRRREEDYAYRQREEQRGRELELLHAQAVARTEAAGVNQEADSAMAAAFRRAGAALTAPAQAAQPDIPPGASLPNPAPAQAQPADIQPLLMSNGQPFGSAKLAATSAKQRKLPMVPVAVEGGWGLAPSVAPEQIGAPREPAAPASPAAKPRLPTSLLQLVRKAGGVSMARLADVTGENNPRRAGAVGVFTKQGMDLDGLAELLQQHGFMTEADVSDTTSGAEQATELLRRALAGDAPVSLHDADEQIGRAEERKYRARIRQRASEMGIRTTARRFDDIEADVLSQEEQLALEPEDRSAYALDLGGYNETTPAVQSFIDDAFDVFDESMEGQPIEQAMRALGFTEDEINAELQAGASEGEAGEADAGRAESSAEGADPRQADQGQGEEEGLTLDSYTPTDLAQREAAAREAESAEAREQRALAERERQAQEHAEVRVRSEVAADTFELGMDPMENLSGQGGLKFSRSGADQQFRETERAYGGRDTYERAKAAGRTRLNYRQWVQVRTPAFKAWFGNWEGLRAQQQLDGGKEKTPAASPRDTPSEAGERATSANAGVDSFVRRPLERVNPDSVSKVIDPETGEPFVVYHVTNRDFDAFQTEGKQTSTGDRLDAAFFTDSDLYAEEYAKERPRAGARTMSVFVSMRDPLVVDADPRGFSDPRYEQPIIERARDAGHDGTIFRDEMTGANFYAVFRPEQIKSATGNNGTFDGENPDIRHSFSGQNARTAGLTRTTLRQAIATRLPSMADAFDAMLRRGDEGKRGGVVVVERAGDLAGTFASKTGRTMVEAKSLLQMSVSPDGERQMMSASEVDADTGNRHDFRLAVEKIARERYSGKAPVPVTVNTTNEVVFVSWASARHILRDGTPDWKTALAVLHMEPLMRAAEKKGWAPDYKGRKDPAGAHFYRSDALIDGVEHTVEITVRQHSDGKRYYDHIVVQEKPPVGLLESGLRGNQANANQPTPPFAGGKQSIGQNAPDIKRSSDGAINGFYDPRSGLTFLVAPNLTADTAPAVLLHEATHGKQRGAIDARALALIDARAKAVKPVRDFLNTVAQRMEGAGEAGNASEASAYIVEEAVLQGRQAGFSAVDGKLMHWIERKFGKRVGDLVRDFVAMVRAWGLRAGVPLNPSIDDLVALAKMNVRAMARDETAGGVRFSRAGQAAPPAASAPAITPPARARAVATEIPGETLFRKQQRLHQDQLNRFTVIKEWLADQGVTLSEQADVYKAEERMHSRFANQAEDFRELTVKPLVKKIQKAGFTMDEVAQFLHAQHAEERNKQIASINPQMPDGGSGMKTAEAAAILAAAPAELKTLANELRQITTSTKQILLDAGIITQDIADAWDATYQHYVPLKGGPEAGTAAGAGKGLKARYRGKRALGHSMREEGEWIVENILADHERALMLAEKNRVGQSLLKMALEVGRDDLLTIGKPEKRGVLRNNVAYEVLFKGKTVGSFTSLEAARTFRATAPAAMKGASPADFAIRKTNDPTVVYMASPMLADNEALVYVKGHAVRVQINDDLLARAYGKMGVEALSPILRAGRALNGFLSKAYTGYNPEFLVKNIQRDFTTGLINITGEQGALMAARAMTNYPRAFAQLLRYAVTGKAAPTIAQYRADGGNTGAAYLADLERLGDDIQKEYAAYRGVLANLKKGEVRNAARAAGRKVFNLTLRWIEHLNQASENAMRVAVYKAMLDAGRSRAEAASMAKNSTVNFNRKGELGAQMNAGWLFYNAGVQGTAALAHAHFKGKHKGQAWVASSGMMALGYLWSAAFGGGDEDEYDKLNEYDKARNLMIKAGEGWAKIALPYGYGFFWNLGRALADAQRTGEPGKLPWQVAASFVEEFTPFGATVAGDEPDLVQFALGASPTMAQILLAVAFNRTTMGGPLMPENPNDKFQPDRLKLHRPTQGTMSDQLAGALYAAGLDVSPETINHLGRTFTGGAGKLAQTVVDSVWLKAHGVELDVKEMPFVRQVYTKTDVRNARGAYYRAVDEAKRAASEAKNTLKMGDHAKYASLVVDTREMLSLDLAANRFSAAIKARRDYIDSIRLSDDYTVAEKRQLVKQEEETERDLYERYLEVFKERKAEMRKREVVAQ
ncbi:LPD38 domain-containing protein [Thauera aromatica]|uniref:LPD38 domain-containing protein n=1 Tax=Thauera aromatica TaxID=59405 RepID=UPI001FFCF769|nr:LPD38 domain-containing protein [Thauera aromatica]MCK2097472.1 hypothetical protein [Thauera aromatica]